MRLSRVGLFLILSFSSLRSGASARILPDEAVLEKRVQGLLADGLFLSASQQLIDFTEWHPDESGEAARQLEDIERKVKKMLETPSSSLLDRCYAEGYEHFFNGNPQQAVRSWTKFIEMTGRESSLASRREEVQSFRAALQVRGEALAQERRQRADAQSLQMKLDRCLREGRRFYERGDLKHARLRFHEALGLNPRNSLALRYISLLDELRPEKFDPDRAREYYKEGLRAHRLGQAAEARGLWQAALRLDPDLAEARASLERLSREPNPIFLKDR